LATNEKRGNRGIYYLLPELNNQSGENKTAAPLIYYLLPRLATNEKREEDNGISFQLPESATNKERRRQRHL